MSNDFLERLNDEKIELDEKLTKLESFFNTDNFSNLDEVQRRLLRGQAYHMREYLNILILRLSNLKEKQ